MFIKQTAFKVILLSIILTSFLQYAQKRNIKFDCISLKEGLSQSVVTCIFQDSKGFMWFGTQDGLNKYDGYFFTVYKHVPLDHSSIAENTIRAIYEDEDGVLWIGTEGGSSKFNRASETFTHYKHHKDDPDSLSDNNVSAIVGGGNGILWLGTHNGGLNRFNINKGKFKSYKNDPKNPDSLSDNWIYAICKGKGDILWIATASGLNKFDTKTEKFKRYMHDPSQSNSLCGNSILSLCIDRHGNLWIGTDGKGLNKFDTLFNTFTHYKHQSKNPNSLSHNVVRAIIEDRTGTLWIGTDGKLNRFTERVAEKNSSGKNRILTGSSTEEDGKFVRYGHDPTNPTSLSNNEIMSLYEGKAGVLWIGTYTGGINKYNREKERFKHYKYYYNNPKSLNHNVIVSICEGETGEIWLGTYGGGLNRFDRQREEFTHYKHKPGNLASLCNNNVFSIYRDRSGTLWIGTDGGLNNYNRNLDTFALYKHDPKNPNSLSDSEIVSILEDSLDLLWIGTYNNGLNKFDRKNKRFTRFIHDPADPYSISYNLIYSIYEDHSGTLWIGTGGGGFCKFNRENGTFTHYKHNPDNPNSLSNNKVQAIYETEDSFLWIGTWGGGLNKFNIKEEHFTLYTEKQGLPNNTIYGILGDDQGNLWLSTTSGLTKFDPENETFKNYDVSDGLQSNEFNMGAYHKCRDGEMYFGGINGFNSFFPEKIKDNPHIPPVSLTSFKIFEKKVKLNEPVSELKEISLSYKQNFFSFEFAALDFNIPEKNQYAYMMEGLDKEWIKSGSRRYAVYTYVTPGEYTFRVRGSNNDGVWNNEGISVKIIITPPFWKTGWFTVLTAIVFALLSYLIIHFFRKYLTFSTFWKKKTYIGHYKIIEQIGTGGMGTVFKASHIMDSSKSVAVKVIREELSKDEIHRKRFIKEAAIIDQLDHPHIVKVIERGEYNNRLFIAMEYLKGQLLSMLIQKEEKISITECLRIMVQLVDVILNIHMKNIIHRDLKPENIMLIEKDSNPYYVKLLDFGLARTQSITRLTETGMVMGSINYISPEQISDGDSSYASDIYALGIIFYELLTLKKPFSGKTTVDLMKQIIDKKPIDPIEIRPEISMRMNNLIMNMLNKTPSHRPPTPLLKEIIKSVLQEYNPRNRDVTSVISCPDINKNLQ